MSGEATLCKIVLPDYGGINLILSVLENSLLCGLLFVSSLLQLYLDREGGGQREGSISYSSHLT